MKYVLDTNIVTLLLRGDERVLSHLADVESSDVGIPTEVSCARRFRLSGRRQTPMH